MTSTVWNAIKWKVLIRFSWNAQRLFPRECAFISNSTGCINLYIFHKNQIMPNIAFFGIEQNIYRMSFYKVPCLNCHIMESSILFSTNGSGIFGLLMCLHKNLTSLDGSLYIFRIDQLCDADNELLKGIIGKCLFSDAPILTFCFIVSEQVMMKRRMSPFWKEEECGK